jgi:LysW-gamma-L-lysine carboxypeptidase
MNSTSDGFNESASLRIGLRLPPAILPDKVIARLHELKGGGDLKITDPLPPYKAEKNTPLVRAFLASIRQAAGSPIFSLKTGTSDMNIVAPVWGCQTVAYGPGDSTLDHTPNEHIQVDEYLRSIDVLETVLKLMVGLTL